jgi:simple sugar transport system ATP-binding protein
MTDATDGRATEEEYMTYDEPVSGAPEVAATDTGGGTSVATSLIEVREIGKRYGNIIALCDVSTIVRAGEVTCVLGDNGAGKSTFIKILAGAHAHTDGQLFVNGEEKRLSSPREALELGIATVYQDLAVVSLMPVWRNFFLGSELTKGFGPFRRLDIATMKETSKAELAAMGIDLRDVDQPIGTLSGGERQCVAIARAVYFGAKVLILDEPTAALGVKQSGVVLKYIAKARERGLGVVFITHNPHHAYPVGDRFMLLRRGKSMGDFAKSELALEDLTSMMAGGAELESLAHELEGTTTGSAIAAEIKAEIS